MELVIINKYCGIVDVKDINDIKEVETIKTRYKTWYPLSFSEFDFIIED